MLLEVQVTRGRIVNVHYGVSAHNAEKTGYSAASATRHHRGTSGCASACELTYRSHPHVNVRVRQHALIDTGSEASLVSAETASRLSDLGYRQHTADERVFLADGTSTSISGVITVPITGWAAASSTNSRSCLHWTPRSSWASISGPANAISVSTALNTWAISSNRVVSGPISKRSK